MKFIKALRPAWMVMIFALLSSGCGIVPSDLFPDSLFPERTLTPGLTLAPISGNNVMPVTVNGALCAPGSYTNKPCVAVTICPPSLPAGSAPDASCQTITDVLIDTGSSGLRVFKSAIRQDLRNTFTQVKTGGKPVAECITFGDGSSDWGPVQMASVVLANEPSVQVPIQVIDSTFGDSSTPCDGASTSIEDAGYTAILGVGLFKQDCGAACANFNSGAGMYFTCDSSDPSATCSGADVRLMSQVTNPARLLPVDNNGVILDLPAIPLGGVDYANGYAILGIGTQTNNTVDPNAVTTYAADPVAGEFKTTSDGRDYNHSFIDSGTNDLYYEPSVTIDDCSGVDSRLANWFCPNTVQSFQATNKDYWGNGHSADPVSFQIGSFVSLFGTTNNNVFSELGQNSHDGGDAFDWGLPFFLGKRVYVGFDQETSNLGTGPFWSY